MFNQDNVELVDVRSHPITEFTETGITTSNGETRDFDIVVLATGFDSITGGITQIPMYGTDDMTSIEDKWYVNPGRLHSQSDLECYYRSLLVVSLPTMGRDSSGILLCHLKAMLRLLSSSVPPVH